MGVAANRRRNDSERHDISRVLVALLIFLRPGRVIGSVFRLLLTACLPFPLPSVWV